VTHVEGDVNPVRDLEIISEELRLKDGEYLVKAMADLEKVATRSGDKKKKPELECLMKMRAVLEEEKKDVRFGTWSSGDIEVLNKHLFLTAKPVMYLVNLSEKDYTRKKNKWYVHTYTRMIF
jgi:obg-like ATPase 1